MKTLVSSFALVTSITEPGRADARSVRPGDGEFDVESGLGGVSGGFQKVISLNEEVAEERYRAEPADVRSPDKSTKSAGR
jgi:hypothetical protein